MSWVGVCAIVPNIITLVETKLIFLQLHVSPKELKDGSAVFFLKHITHHSWLEVGNKESFEDYILFFSFTTGIHPRVHTILDSSNFIPKQLKHVWGDWSLLWTIPMPPSVNNVPPTTNPQYLWEEQLDLKFLLNHLLGVSISTGDI